MGIDVTAQLLLLSPLANGIRLPPRDGEVRARARFSVKTPQKKARLSKKDARDANWKLAKLATMANLGSLGRRRSPRR
jgi:hypothetical protein